MVCKFNSITAKDTVTSVLSYMGGIYIFLFES